MTRIILVTSGKGGVGKTTLTANLAYALTSMGDDVIAVDTNLTTPNMGLHLGMHLPNNTLHDVLKGDVKLEKTIYPHPFGFRFIPSSISTDALSGVNVSRLQNVTFNLMGKSDYVLMDCAAGLGREAVSAVEAADEILIVTNPDMPSVADALKMADISRKMGKSIIGVVVNRRKGKDYELTVDEIRDIMGLPIISQIPEDRMVAESVAAKQPIIEYSPNSDAAIEINRLAHKITGRPFSYRKPINMRILDGLVGWMSR